MKKQRINLLFWVLMPVLLILTGCGIQTGQIIKQEENQIVLSVLAGQSTSDAGVEDMINEKIAERFPNVRLEWECVDWGAEFDEQIRLRFASGNIPDIIIGKAQDIKAYVSTGNLAPLSDACTMQIEEEALSSVTEDGVVYGMPYNAWYQGVVYNKKIFERYGLSVPKTEEEMNYIIGVLKKNGITPFAGHYQESWKIGNITMQFMMNEIFDRQPDWGDRFRNREVSYSNSQEIKKCMQYHQKMIDASWSDVLYIDQFECDSRFINEEAAMYLTGSWSLQFAEQYSAEDAFGIFPFPDAEGNASLIKETNMTFMKSTATEYDELVDGIFEMLISDTALMEQILEFTQTFSVVEGVDPEFQNCLLEDIVYYETNGQVIDVTGGNTQLVWTFQNDVSEQTQQWLQGTISLDEVLTYADAHRTESINE